MTLEIDDYEAQNLLWLLRVARRLGLDTGDWLGQLMFKLDNLISDDMRGPNCGPIETEQHLELAARRILGDE